ncbi:MAG: hypothetical protein IKZ18_07305, partial [Bacteroidaceae bacterium]|nr:hypothetical protein [Bacteroidaceae bacterium]
MKKNLLLTCLLAFVALFGKAQSSTWPITLTSADGLPGTLELSTYVYKSPLYTFDEAVTTLRLTVCHTNSSYPSPEGFNGRATWSPGWAFWSLAEFRIFDENGDEVTYTPTSNAVAPGDGSLEGLYDKNISTHFHTTYGSGPMDQYYPYVDFQIERDDLTSFRFEWDTRNGYHHNQPTYIGLTPGTEYWPMPEQNLSVEKITSTEDLKEAGALFVLEGHSADWEDPDRDRTNIGGGFFEAPCLATAQPSAFGVFYLIPVEGEEDTYKVRYLNHNHYIRKTNTGGFNFVEWTANANNAEAITFKPNASVEGDFTLTAHHDSVILGQDANVRMMHTVNTDSAIQAAPRAVAATNFSVYKATINGNTVAYQLQEAIDEAEARIAAYGEMEDYVEDQYDVLVAAVAEAKDILAAENVSAAAVITTAASLSAKTANYAAMNIYAWVDSVTTIMDALNNGSILTSSGPDWINNSYPEDADVALQNAIDRGDVVAETYRGLEDIDNVIEEIKGILASFWASKITNVKSLPFRLGQEKDGLPGEKTNSVYRWESPFIYLTEEVEELRFTVFKTKSGRNFSGTSIPFVCINEFELYSITGEKIELTEDMFETNSLKSSDGNSGGIAGLCDNNTNNSYHFHSAWDSNNDTGYDGSEYVYLDIVLPEPISGFKYIQYARGNGYDDAPTDFVFGYYGETVDPVSVPFPDDYNAIRGAQVKDISEISDNGFYAIYGMLNCDPEEGTGAEGGFYTSNNRYVGAFQSPCAFTIRKTGDEDGTYYIQSLADGKFWQSARTNAPDYWTSGSATTYKSQAAKVKIEPNNNDNLPYSFVMYEYIEDSYREVDGEDTACPYVIAQDWGGGLGWYNVPSLDMNDKDGEGEWYIYHMSMDNPNTYWLTNLVKAAEGLGLKESSDPGCYSSLGEFPQVLAESQLAVEANDEAKAKTLVVKLSDAIAAVENAQVNPVVEGTYVFETFNSTFIEVQKTRKAIYFMEPHTCGEFCGEYELGWRTTPEDFSDIDPMFLIQLESAANDSQVAAWLADSLITPEEVNSAFYIKSTKFNKYASHPDPEEAGGTSWYGLHLLLQDTPQPYMVLFNKNGAFDIWLPGGGEYNDTENGNLCFHVQDHNNGAGNAGHIVYW